MVFLEHQDGVRISLDCAQASFIGEDRLVMSLKGGELWVFLKNIDPIYETRSLVLNSYNVEYEKFIWNVVIFSAWRYVVTLLIDGMRSVRGFNFDKAAASVLTTCVSSRLMSWKVFILVQKSNIKLSYSLSNRTWTSYIYIYSWPVNLPWPTQSENTELTRQLEYQQP